MYAIVAERDGRVVGLAHYLIQESTSKLTPVCYLQDLFVDPNVRGGGHGRALIEHVADHARARQATRLYWNTHETNATAMALYERVAERSGFLVYRKLLA